MVYLKNGEADSSSVFNIGHEHIDDIQTPKAFLGGVQSKMMIDGDERQI